MMGVATVGLRARLQQLWNLKRDLSAGNAAPASGFESDDLALNAPRTRNEPN